MPYRPSVLSPQAVSSAVYRRFGVVPVMQMTIVKQRERIVIEFQICFFSMLMDDSFSPECVVEHV